MFAVIIAFQLSWNVVTAYCMHETGRAAMHFGHHQHQSTADELKVAAKDKLEPVKKLPVHDAHCASCAHISIAAPDLTGSLALVESRDDLALQPTLVPVSAFLSPPERPQWAGRA
jgi:hypothetical protein